MVSRAKDITGNKYGRLTATYNTGNKSSTGNYIWKFLCDCGNQIEAAAGNVIHGSVSSCGCYRTECLQNRATHRMKDTKEYKSWCKAKERCFTSTCKSYKDYGAIGITMSEEFAESFVIFVEHIGEMPKDGKKYTLDRIDNKKGYERGNIRWATSEQQARNKRSQRNNSSGFSGVSWDNKVWENGENLYAKAQWNNLDGNLCSKRFAVKIYGLLPAFKLACEHRIAMIEELNKQGAGYSPRHGK